MKNLFGLILVLMVMLVSTAQAQVPMKKVGDPTTYMTAEQLAKYQSDITNAELEKKLHTYGNWVGVGSEVGIAVKEGLSAVVDVADKFSGTNVGKFTIILIAWKVVGKDVLRIILGIFFIIGMSIIHTKIYKSLFMPKRVLIKNTPQGFWKRSIKEWETHTPSLGWDGVVFVKILMLVAYGGIFGLSFVIMFA